MRKTKNYYAVSLRLDRELKEQLQKIAQVRGQTIAELTREMIKGHVFGDPKPHHLFEILNTKLNLVSLDLATVIKALLILSGKFSAEEAATWVSKNMRSIC